MEYIITHLGILAAFFAGLLFSYWATGILCLFFFIADYREASEKWLTFFGLIFILSLFPQIQIHFNILYVVGYVILGFVWSIFRFTRRCDFIVKTMKENVKENPNLGYCKYVVEDILPSNNKHRIINWILFFPISVIRWALNDIIDLMCTIFDKFLVNIYNIFAKKYLNQAKELKATSDAIKKAKAKAGQEARMGKNRVTHARQPDTM